MADELELLLDEVEARLCRLSAPGAARGPLRGGREDEEGEKEEEGAAAKGRLAVRSGYFPPHASPGGAVLPSGKGSGLCRGSDPPP